MLFQAFVVHTDSAFKAGEELFSAGLLNFDLHTGKCKITRFIEALTKQTCGIYAAILSITTISSMALTKRNRDRIWTNRWI